MAGQRSNPKMLKLVGGAAALLISTYILYGYRQASNDVQLKTRHLSEAKEEYAALSRRFDMLSNELKGSVQASADLDRQLRMEKKSHQQTLNEKQEVERQCRTEAIRLENEKAQVVKEKQQLIEDEGQVQRERDRVSARLDTLTQECSEAKEVAQSKEHQLQGRLDQCQAGYGSVDGELSKCKSSLLEANSAKAQCSSEMQVIRNDCQECQSSRTSLQKQLQLMQNQLPQQGGYNQQQGFNDPQGRGDFNNPHQGREFSAPQQGGLSIPQQGGPGNSWRNDQVNQAQPGFRDRDGNFHPSLQQERQRHDALDTGGQQAVGGYQDRDNNFHHSWQVPQQHDSMLRRDTGGQQGVGGHDQEERSQALGHQEPGHEELQEQPAGGGHHKTLEEKRTIYRALKEKVQKGIVLQGKQLQVYELLSRQFGEEDQPVGHEGERPAPGLGGQEPAPRLVDEGAEQPAPQLVEDEGQELDENKARPPVAGGIQQPPPGGQNEQEEVKDLVDGGQQKPEVFENVKEHQPDAVEEGGAREPNKDPDEGVELRGLEGGGKQLDGDDDDDHVPKPIPNPLDHADPELPGAQEREEAEKNVDDEEYGAVDVEDKRNNPAGEDMYNQERRRLIQREAQEKVPDEEVLRERDGHWRDLEHHGAAAKREMR